MTSIDPVELNIYYYACHIISSLSLHPFLFIEVRKSSSISNGGLKMHNHAEKREQASMKHVQFSIKLLRFLFFFLLFKQRQVARIINLTVAHRKQVSNSLILISTQNFSLNI